MNSEDSRLNIEDSASVALVTGGNRGIGKAVCLGLADQGIHTVVAARSLEEGKKVSRQIAKMGRSSEAVALDVQSVVTIERVARYLKEKYGKLNIIVNNAGILTGDDRKSNFRKLPEEAFRETVDVNLFGTYRVCQTFLPLIEKAPWGRIVNVTSAMGNLTDTMTGGYTAYRVSKAAVNALTANLSAELKSKNILVNCVHPGWVRTRMGTMVAPLSPRKGADSIIYAATLPANGPTGKFIVKRQIQPF